MTDRQILEVYDLIGLHHSQPFSVLMANLRNIKRFSDYLNAVENEFFMVEEEPEDEHDEPYTDCLLNKFGLDQEKYIEQFRAALKIISTQSESSVIG